jgi:dipeptidase E
MRLRAALPRNPQVLFVCANPDDHERTDEFAEAFTNAFEEAGMPFAGAATLDHRNVADAAKLIATADFIIMSGGHVPTQNKFFQEICLRKLMEGYQGVVMGISAGTMNCADTVYAQPEEPGESDPEFERFLPGLGLTDINVLPHYQQVKDYMLDGKRLFEDVTYCDSWGHTFYAFPDGTYLYADDREKAIYGRFYRIRDGILELLQVDEEKYIL